MEFRSLLSCLDYPAGRSSVVEKRLSVLKKCGVKELECLAKGYRGAVLKGFMDGRAVAVKVPRSDSGKPSFLEKEWKILTHLSEKLGKDNVAPEPICYAGEALVMEFIKGLPFYEALEVYDPAEVVSSALLSCYLLDSAGVEHSEIKGKKHLIFDGKKVRIIDFESAKFKERPRNLFQFVGYHLLGPGGLADKLGLDRKEILSALDFYSRDKEKGLSELRRLLSKSDGRF
ncbi:MAG: hypothetical protein ABGX12_06970 [Desulfurobacteriaceae bacterium]